MEYLSMVPRPPLDELIDDLYYLAGSPPYPVLSLPLMPSVVLILNLGDPFLIDTGGETAAYSDGCVLTTMTRALRFSYPAQTISVGVHFKPWGLAPFLSMPAAELCDRPLTVEQVWGRASAAELTDRLAAARGPRQLLSQLETELLTRLGETVDLGLVRHVGGIIAGAGGRTSIGGICTETGVSSTHLARRFRDAIGITPKRLARIYRFAATVSGLDPLQPVDWSELANRAGYYDQAHFSHEFRDFTGLTPNRYLDVRRRFLREHPGHALDVGPLPAD
jgi:AraC-like DNA-binding protein